MNKMIYLILATLLGSFGAWVISPFWGVFVYYHLALLRPQFIWNWDLPVVVSWSLVVALSTIAAAVARVVVDFGRSQGDTGEAPVPLSPVYVPMLMLSIWTTLTCFTAQNFTVASSWAWEYLKLWIMFGASAVLIRTRQQIYILYGMACVTLTYLAYEVNFQYLVNHNLSVYFNGLGGYDNNGAGLMMAMTIPLCYFAFEAFTRWWRYLFLFAPLLLLHGVLLTYSRGAMVSLLLAVPIMLLRSRHPRRLAGALFLFALFGLPMFAGKQIQDRFLTISQNDVDATANSRRDSWRAAWRIACDYPVFGVGVRNSNLFSFKYGADQEGRTIHNQYLQVTADSGFIGGALYIWMLYSTWVAIRRSRTLLKNEEEEDLQARSMLAGLESALFIFCIGAVFLSLETFEFTYLLILLVAQMPGILGREAYYKRKAEEWQAEQEELDDMHTYAESEAFSGAGSVSRR